MSSWLEHCAASYAYRTASDEDFSIPAYHRILSTEMPPFLQDYLELPLLRRLRGVGLLCGTDWTPLFHNRFFYSRFDHSIGVALLIWNFTHDKTQTLAGLLHDVSTPAFSHVSDFRNGDALLQESTECDNGRMIDEDAALQALLLRDSISCDAVRDYHLYPVADNAMPGLSADRLEYMYPSGAALNGVWSLADIAANYAQIVLLRNEQDLPELGFASMEAAATYTRRFCDVSHLLQRNEDKLALQLMADILSQAMDSGLITERDVYRLSERELMRRFSQYAAQGTDASFCRLFATYRQMDCVLHTDRPVENAYCVSLKVKKRYVNPLVRIDSSHSQRIADLDGESADCIDAFLHYEDSPYGCVLYKETF